MGGAIFTSGPDPLYTPRMPRAVYIAARTQCHTLLRSLFWAVASPIDGPGKVDFGDIDVLVALPRGGDADGNIFDAVARRLGAVRSIVNEHQNTASMAVAWPVSVESAPPPGDASAATTVPGGESASPPRDASSAPSPGDATSAYIQIDIAILPTLARFHWSLFHHAHGDFWNILATAVLRPLGFTLDDRALWLRVPEIEHAHRQRAKVWLTDEPAVVLFFLNLKDDCWDAPFADATALFEYSATCRFFVLPDACVLADRLKSNDRRRLNDRPLFRKWATEYVPGQTRLKSASAAATTEIAGVPAAAAAAASDVPATRNSARDAAFAFFPGTQARFDDTRASWLRERHLLAVRTAVKSAVPTTLPGQYRGDVCAAVRRHLGLVTDEARADVAKQAAEEAAAAWTAERVAAYVAAEWPVIAQGIQQPVVASKNVPEQ